MGYKSNTPQSGGSGGSGVTSIGGLTGVVLLGTNLSVTGQTINASGGGGGGSPGGTNGQIQYNNSGSFGGGNLTYGVDGSGNPELTPGTGQLTIGGNFTYTGQFFYSNATIAAAGTNQATATPFTADTVVVASGTGGVALPAATLGAQKIVINITNANINVYTVSGGNDSINSLTTSQPYVIPPFFAGLILSDSTQLWTAEISNVPSGFQYNTEAYTTTTTLSAADVSGPFGFVDVTLNLTGTLSGNANAQLPTVSSLVSALINPMAGQQYRLRIVNNSSANFTWTPTTNTGWTLNNISALQQGQFQDYYVTLTSLTTATLQGLSLGGATSFATLTSGTNTAATMTVGAGGILTYSSSGQLNASALQSFNWSVPSALGTGTPNSGAFTTVTANSSITVTSTSATAFSVGPSGATNSTLQVNCATASAATGFLITGAAAGSGVTMQAISTATNESASFNSKGTGTVTLGAAGGTVKLSISGSANFSVTASAQAALNATTNTASTVRYSWVTSVDAALTASTEAPAVYFNLGNTRTHATGSYTTQRDYRITGSPHAFATGGGTITNCATFEIDGYGQAGTNAIFTNAAALYIPTQAVAGTVTNAYAAYIFAPTGAGTVNAALNTSDGTNTVRFSDGTYAINATAGGINVAGSSTLNGIYLPTAALETALYANGNSGTSFAIAMNNGNNQSVVITGICTFTFTAPTNPGKFTIIFKQNATGYAYTLPTIKWPGGVAPTKSTAANAIDILTVLYDGSTYYGVMNTAFA